MIGNVCLDIIFTMISIEQVYKWKGKVASKSIHNKEKILSTVGKS